MPTRRQIAERNLTQAAKTLTEIDRQSFLSYSDEANIATHAQVFATTAVAHALLDIADAIRDATRQT